jgi:murein L,D-transpeptidase YafK
MGKIRFLPKLLLAAGLAAMLAGCGGIKFQDNRHNVPLKAQTVSALTSIGSSPSEAMMIRIFKEENALEVWKRTASGSFRMFKSYEICAWSGAVGPKFKEGDRQAPEGFYTITPGLMNPKSNYFLAFNTGFPNKFDQVHGRTGSNLMVHGDCSSSGCYSMTDDSIAEIYALARESFTGGNASFQLQIFPFRMTPQNLAKHKDSEHMPFWSNIKEGYDRFELAKAPASWDVCEKRYVFDVKSATPLDAAGACPAGTRTLTASLSAKQAADKAALDKEIAAINAKKAKQDDLAKREADAEAAAKARGQAIGSFIGGMFGGAAAGESKTLEPSLKAPVPKPRLQRG